MTERNISLTADRREAASWIIHPDGVPDDALVGPLTYELLLGLGDEGLMPKGEVTIRTRVKQRADFGDSDEAWAFFSKGDVYVTLVECKTQPIPARLHHRG